MKIFKDLNDNLWAYELDGSQDDLIPSGYIQITDEEADAIRIEQQTAYLAKLPLVVPPTKEELLVELQVLTDKIHALTVQPQ